jgi:lycopene cyclase domain-containing protein
VWAGPVFALQWGVGWRYLVAVRRRLVAIVAAPVLYLSVIDRIAIGEGLWTISPAYSTGLTVGGLPIEEGAFFLCTTLFVVQALVLLRWVIARWG